MDTWTQLGCQVALVDSDALQRLCTGNSLTSVGADYTGFEEVSELVEAIREGRQFDAIVLGLHARLHAGVVRTMSQLLDAQAAAGRPLPVLYVVHPSEMGCVHRLPAPMRLPPAFQLMPSPVEDPALLWWLNGLDLWGRRAQGDRRNSAC